MFSSILPQGVDVFSHSDTYGIAVSGQSTIPLVSDAIPDGNYDDWMPKKRASNPDWGIRIRRHIKASGKRMGEIADLMEMSESGLRMWLNGTNKINLEDFERLCAVVEIDACTVLVGRPALTERQWSALRTVTGVK